jgi:hypothetical protein
MKEPAGNGRRWRRARRALWRFAHDGTGWGQATPMSVLADDVAAHDLIGRRVESAVSREDRWRRWRRKGSLAACSIWTAESAIANRG